MPIEKLIKHYEGRLKYFEDELYLHENLDISIFYPEQKEIYYKNVSKFKEQISISEETIRYLKLIV